jgi:TolB-like protein
MTETGTPPGSEGPALHDKKLSSWKEIASHVGREVRTVQRWEKTEGLPVRRHEHLKKCSVYAYASELDEWFRKRQPADDPDADAAFEPEPDIGDAPAGSENGDVVFAKGVPNSGNNADSSSSDDAVQPKPRRRMRRVLAAAATAVLCLAGYSVYRWIQLRNLKPEKVRLVVLPFTNLSGDSKQDYFSAGLTDELITRLGSLDPGRLGVIAAKSSMAVAGKPLGEIGRALNVQYALEGSVRREGNHVRIDVQLIQISDQTHLWADSYNRELNDILLVHDDVGRAVASQIRLALNPSSGKGAGNLASHSVNPAAYDAYLLGRFYSTNRGDLHKSIEAYQEVIHKDPQYALA